MCSVHLPVRSDDMEVALTYLVQPLALGNNSTMYCWLVCMWLCGVCNEWYMSALLHPPPPPPPPPDRAVREKAREAVYSTSE